jgi:hypothetical protein
MWPALLRQLKYEDYFVKRALPATAKPYREDFHASALGQAPAQTVPAQAFPAE